MYENYNYCIKMAERCMKSGNFSVIKSTKCIRPVLHFLGKNNNDSIAFFFNQFLKVM